MKIYTRIVTDMRSGAVLEEESFEYSGPVALCKGSGKVKETEEEKELARIASERWDRYEDVFKPLEGTLIKRLDMGEAEREQAGGLAHAAIQSEFAPVEQKVQMGLQRRGVAPGSGAAVAAGGGLTDARASADALSQTDTDQAVADLQYQGLEHMIAMGRGKAVAGMSGLSAIAQNANQRAITDAQTAFTTRQGNVRAGMAAAGAGIGYYTNRPQPPAAQGSGGFDLAFGGAGGPDDILGVGGNP